MQIPGPGAYAHVSLLAVGSQKRDSFAHRNRMVWYNAPGEVPIVECDQCGSSESPRADSSNQSHTTSPDDRRAHRGQIRVLPSPVGYRPDITSGPAFEHAMRGAGLPAAARTAGYLTGVTAN